MAATLDPPTELATVNTPDSLARQANTPTQGQSTNGQASRPPQNRPPERPQRRALAGPGPPRRRAPRNAVGGADQSKNRAWSAIKKASQICTIIGVILFIPSVLLSKWSAQREFREACLDTADRGISLSQQCNESIAAGPTAPPFVKRSASEADTGLFTAGNVLIVILLLIVDALLVALIYRQRPLPQPLTGILDTGIHSLLHQPRMVLIVCSLLSIHSYATGPIVTVVPLVTFGSMYSYLAMFPGLAPRRRARTPKVRILEVSYHQRGRRSISFRPALDRDLSAPDVGITTGAQIQQKQVLERRAYAEVQKRLNSTLANMDISSSQLTGDSETATQGYMSGILPNDSERFSRSNAVNTLEDFRNRARSKNVGALSMRGSVEDLPFQ